MNKIYVHTCIHTYIYGCDLESYLSTYEFLHPEFVKFQSEGLDNKTVFEKYLLSATIHN